MGWQKTEPVDIHLKLSQCGLFTDYPWYRALGVTGGASGKEPANAGHMRDMGSSLDREDALQEGMAAHSRVLGESHGQRSLAGYSPQGLKESDTTEGTSHAHVREQYKI